MQSVHWITGLFLLLVGMLVQWAFDPLGYVGL